MRGLKEWEEWAYWGMETLKLENPKKLTLRERDPWLLTMEPCTVPDRIGIGIGDLSYLELRMTL